MNANLKYVPESDAWGVTAFKADIDKVLAGRPTESVLHSRLLQELDDASRTYRVLVLKTRQTLPYTSVFLRLKCKYWSDGAEKHMRERMAGAATNGQ